MKKIVLAALWIAVGAVGMLLIRPGGPSGSSPQGEEKPHGGHEEGSEHHEAPGQVELTPEAAKVAAITLGKVEKRSLEGDIVLPGVITANQDRLAHVTPRIRGRVEKIGALLGQEVKRGDQLAALDSVDLGNARAAFMKARAARDATQTNFQREERLIKREATTEPEYLTAKAAFQTAEAEFRATRETLLLYGLPAKEIDSLSWDHVEPIGYFPILAPFDGTIIEKHITIGEVVDTGNNLFTIADLSTLWLLLDLPQSDFPRVKVGQEVEGRVQGNGEKLHGKVTYVSDVLRAETRTTSVRVEVTNPDRNLKPGMFVSATLRSGDKDAVLTVPVSAVQRIGEATIVFVPSKKEKDHYVRVPVTLGRRSGERQVVLAGVKEGDDVITEGSFVLKSELLRSQMGDEHSD